MDYARHARKTRARAVRMSCLHGGQRLGDVCGCAAMELEHWNYRGSGAEAKPNVDSGDFTCVEIFPQYGNPITLAIAYFVSVEFLPHAPIHNFSFSTFVVPTSPSLPTGLAWITSKPILLVSYPFANRYSRNLISS
jgi:hypothetical protein